MVQHATLVAPAPADFFAVFLSGVQDHLGKSRYLEQLAIHQGGFDGARNRKTESSNRKKDSLMSELVSVASKM